MFSLLMSVRSYNYLRDYVKAHYWISSATSNGNNIAKESIWEAIICLKTQTPAKHIGQELSHRTYFLHRLPSLKSAPP